MESSKVWTQGRGWETHSTSLVPTRIKSCDTALKKATETDREATEVACRSARLAWGLGSPKGNNDSAGGTRLARGRANR